jgi:hypothetical protein
VIQKRNQGLLYRHCPNKDSCELTTLVVGRGDGLGMDPNGPYRHGLQIVRGLGEAAPRTEVGWAGLFSVWVGPVRVWAV